MPESSESSRADGAISASPPESTAAEAVHLKSLKELDSPRRAIQRSASEHIQSARHRRSAPRRQDTESALLAHKRGARRRNGNSISGDDRSTGRSPSVASGRAAQSTADFREQLEKGESNILVAVRVRPLLPKEVRSGERDILRVMDGHMIIALDPNEGETWDVLRVNRSREKRFAFDCAFDKSSSSRTVFEGGPAFLTQGVMDGYNATVFAYGATGSGKTFTMLGTDQEPGIMVQTLDSLFSKMKEDELNKFEVTISYIEVYNEKLKDLFNPGGDDLDLRFAPDKGVTVCGASEIVVYNSDEILGLLSQGNENRSTEPTNRNECSSRSHAVLRVVVSKGDRASGLQSSLRVGTLSMIDLAGSERAAETNNRGLRLREGANINRSLLALGNCINSLADPTNRGRFINYRDSKLTRLLQDSLGGNCRTVMISCVSPSHAVFEETVNTLKYANRAKNIKTKVVRNELNVDFHVAQYKEIISSLKDEVQRLRHELEDSQLNASLEQSLGEGEEEGASEHKNSAGIRRVQESRMVDSLREKIRENVSEQVELLKKVKDTGLKVLQLKRENQMDSFEDLDHSKERALTRSLRSKKREQLLQEENERNTMLNDQLDILNRELHRIRETQFDRVHDKDLRELLEVEYKRGEERRDAEKERDCAMEQEALRRREQDELIRKLQAQLEDRDRVIAEQRDQLLKAQGIDPDANEHSLKSSTSASHTGTGGAGGGGARGKATTGGRWASPSPSVPVGVRGTAVADGQSNADTASSAPRGKGRRGSAVVPARKPQTYTSLLRRRMKTGPNGPGGEEEDGASVHSSHTQGSRGRREKEAGRTGISPYTQSSRPTRRTGGSGPAKAGNVAGRHRRTRSSIDAGADDSSERESARDKSNTLSPVPVGRRRSLSHPNAKFAPKNAPAKSLSPSGGKRSPISNARRHSPSTSVFNRGGPVTKSDQQPNFSNAAQRGSKSARELPDTSAEKTDGVSLNKSVPNTQAYKSLFRHWVANGVNENSAPGNTGSGRPVGGSSMADMASSPLSAAAARMGNRFAGPGASANNLNAQAGPLRSPLQGDVKMGALSRANTLGSTSSLILKQRMQQQKEQLSRPSEWQAVSHGQHGTRMPGTLCMGGENESSMSSSPSVGSQQQLSASSPSRLPRASFAMGQGIPGKGSQHPFRQSIAGSTRLMRMASMGSNVDANGPVPPAQSTNSGPVAPPSNIQQMRMRQWQLQQGRSASLSMSNIHT